MLKNKKMKAIGLLSIALGLGLNMQYAWNDYSFKESPLLVRVVMAEMESGMCVGRGGSEMPNQVLIREDCTYYIQVGGDISISHSGGGGGLYYFKAVHEVGLAVEFQPQGGGLDDFGPLVGHVVGGNAFAGQLEVHAYLPRGGGDVFSIPAQGCCQQEGAYNQFSVHGVLIF